MTTVPWNAMWTEEDRYEVRPCRWAEGKPAIWAPHLPGQGAPVFAKPHPVRQRLSVARMLCTVCGRPTPADDRWWFAGGQVVGDLYATTEAPVHGECARLARRVCPHLSRRGFDPLRFPGGHSVIASLVGGDAVTRDFGLRVPVQFPVIGHLKLVWPTKGHGLHMLRHLRIPP